MFLLKELLINLLVILLVVLLFSMFLWNRRRFVKDAHIKGTLFGIAAFLIIFSLFLSIEYAENFLYDLRFVPFVIAAMYGGKWVTVGLAALLIAIRIPYGGTGVVATIVIMLLTSIILLKIIPKFHFQTTNWRLLFTAFMSFLYACISYLIPSIIYEFLDPIDMLVYFTVLIGSTIFVTYLTEVLRTFYIYQQEIIRNEKMEIVSHLAASISHEVKNPLTTVRGFLQLILEDKELKNHAREYASLAIGEVDRASGIIDDYLTFAKPHSGNHIELDIRDPILKCTDIIKPLALSGQVSVETTFSHKKSIVGEPNKLLQVLLNLCKNSIEAMPEGGQLYLSTIEEKDQVHVHISDTGHGMSNEHIARLGEPYFSLKKQKGTGLGMMVVFRLVESMNGQIKIWSKEKIGTTIVLTFPTKQKISKK